ncbi:hypothetical protein AAFF_G00093540 [Aldrovandia affinis]|uniref:Armadillo repeat-containing protein 1 n=1 Tax=Aldrovandia affinis TaxID=143900 RepID=A0AAD7T3J2_9TELE|nr:hypothetical protein AAFF_G00093540 [Aldrovandia affinis]
MSPSFFTGSPGAQASRFDVRGTLRGRTMSGHPDALTVVNQLRDLAADPLNRRPIVQDQGCLPGLILFLDHPYPQVVYSALLALRYLAECRANREKMKGELGMMLSLQNVMQNWLRAVDSRPRKGPLTGQSLRLGLCLSDAAPEFQHRPRLIIPGIVTLVEVVHGWSLCGVEAKGSRVDDPGETKLLASEIYEILQAAGSTEADQADSATSCRRKAQFFLGTTNKRAKTVVLHIDGLDDTSRRSLCEEALLKIRGVISFTFQMAVKRCVVRIRSDLKAEALGTAIASTKVMKAQQVVKGDDGDEVMVSFQDDTLVLVEENTDLPDYLPEEESPSKELDKAVSRVGSIQDGAGWLSAAANFLSRSFYW